MSDAGWEFYGILVVQLFTFATAIFSTVMAKNASSNSKKTENEVKPIGNGFRIEVFRRFDQIDQRFDQIEDNQRDLLKETSKLTGRFDQHLEDSH